MAHVTDRLSDYLDDELDATERLRVEGHLEECGECRGTLEELRAVMARASTLRDTGPERDLWTGVEARIDRTQTGARTSWTFQSAVRKRVTFTLPQLAAAALALMVLSGGLVWRARSGDPRADFQPVSASDVSPSAGDAAEAALAQVLDAHLRAIDAAIAECNGALAEHPDLQFLSAHRERLKAQRVTLLRDTADQHSGK